MKIITNLLLLLFTIQIIGCSDEKKGTEPEDKKPNTAATIGSFSPESGEPDTEISIVGENFGTNPSEVRFYFGETKAAIIEVSDKLAVVTVPQKLDTKSYLSVATNGDSTSCYEQLFNYITPPPPIAKGSITTIAGKADAAGSNDGTMLEARFDNPKGGMAIDAEGNILITDGWGKRLRLISQLSNSVTTLESDGTSLRQPTLLADGKTFYVATWDDAKTNTYSAATQWKPQYKGMLVAGESYESYVEIADKLPGKFIVRNWNGQIYTIPQTDITQSSMVEIDHVRSQDKGSASWMCYNPVDEYLYLAIEKSHDIWRAKVNDNGTLDKFAHWAGSAIGDGGHFDGNVAEALFMVPTSIAVDSKGNLYVADCQNHVIRMITLDGVVSTVVGIPTSAGYLDGKPIEAKLNQPYGIVIDKNDHIYITEQLNHCIRKVILE